MYKNISSFFLILSLIISPSLHAGKNKKNIKEQPKSKIETIITHDSINPISDPEEFGFSHLKNWTNLNSRKRIAKERTDIDRLNKALQARNEKNINLAEQLLREGAKQNCDEAMLYLGCLEEENGKFEEAYAWYMISLCTKLLKGKKIEIIQNQNNNPYNKLLSIIKHQNFPQGYKNFLISFTSHILNPRYIFNTKNIIAVFVESLYQLTHYNPILSTFTIELCKWANNKDYFCVLGQVLADDYNLPEIGAYFLRLSQIDTALDHLAKLIFKEKITTDLNGKNFAPQHMNRVLSEISLKIKNPDPEHLSNIGCFILDDIITTINGKSISKNNKYEIAATYLRKSKTPIAFERLAGLIKQGKIQHDENNIQIDPNQKEEIAARNFRRSTSPESMLNLTQIIHDKQTQQDENGHIIPEGEEYNVIARIARKYIQTQAAKYMIANMIHNKQINEDEFGQIIPENQRYEIASKLYIESVQDLTSKTSKFDLSYMGMAHLIYCDYIDLQKGLEMLRYDKEASLTKNEILAELYRRSSTPEALNELALQIYNGLIDKDENNKQIDENQRLKKVFDLLERSSIKEALFNLAGLKLQHTPIKSIETLKECLSLFEKSLSLDYSNALEWCLTLNEEINALENQNKNISELHENLPEFKADTDELNSNSEDTTTSFSTETPEEDTNNFSSQQNNIDEENSLSLEARKKIKAAKKAEKIRELFKRKQKRFQLIKNKLPQDQINDLLINTKKIKNDHKKLHIKWSKKTLDQLNALLSHEKDKVLLLLDDIKENGTMGRPETLKGCDAISRRITQEHRLVYRFHKNNIDILSCKGHYEDKYQ